jgi:hypothetical protein
VASDGADAARQAIRSRPLKYELVINLKTALGREVPMLLESACGTLRHADCASECPLIEGGLNRSPQHFILEGKDGVWDGTEIS